MGSSLIIDNWLLQDIGACLSLGLNEETASELIIDKSNDNHTAIDIPYAGVQIEALLEFLVNIVLRDSLVFDEAFTYTWTEHEDIFSGILNSGLARSLSFLVHEEKLKAPRQFVVDQLCITSSLREAQNRNVESWAAYKQADDPYLSNVIWGTAGMLSRSHVFEALYFGHPLRKRVMEQTILSTSRPDIVSNTLEWMSSQRLRIFQIKNQSVVKETAMIVLPPIAIDIIEESKDINELITVAYQLRDKYAVMREWLKSIQSAVESEDLDKIVKYKKTLDAVSKDIDRAMWSTNTGQISLKIGFGLPSLSIPMGTLDGVMKRFGMRAALNNQIFSPRGEKSIKKLLRMFGEESSGLGFSVQEYLRVKRQFRKWLSMILHCTKKLSAKLPTVSSETLTETSPLGSWHAQVYIIDRHNCLLFCHDDTRYTVFLPGLRKAEFAELGRWFREAFTASLAYMGLPDVQVRKAVLALGPVLFDTCTDRSVLGSLNQMRYMLDARVSEVEDVMQLNPLSVTRWLCHYPVNVRGGKDFWMADESMARRVMNLSA